MGESEQPGAGDARGEHGEFDVRRAKVARWRARGVEPYGGRYERTHTTADLLAHFDDLEGQTVTVAGRLMSLRRQGRVAFADLQDGAGRVQLFARVDVLGPEPFADFLDLDPGDVLGARGSVMRTRAGEVSVLVQEAVLLTKALRPLPDKWHGVRDTEVRYRQRYLDLLVNPQVRDGFVRRSAVVASLRRTLDARGYLEVETPVLHSIASGAAARPFHTHHHALDMELHLRIALELHLKRLIVGGLERVYEIGRVFRNEGVSTRHNPEFTMLECYQAFADYEDIMLLTEELVSSAAVAATGDTRVRRDGQTIEFRPPWRRLSMVDALKAQGIDVLAAANDEEARALARAARVEVGAGATWSQVVDHLVEERVMAELVQPTFLTDHPLALSPLARARQDDPRIACRFEAVVVGMELANAFSELADPQEQRRRFAQQAVERAHGNAEAIEADEDFLRALEHGMPPTGGLGIGVDRLVMLLTGARSIRDVLLFPHLRPEGRDGKEGEGGLDEGGGDE